MPLYCNVGAITYRCGYVVTAGKERTMGICTEEPVNRTGQCLIVQSNPIV